MDQVAGYVADAVLGIVTIWGGDVMCPSGTGRFIADSWFADERLPAAYTHATATKMREMGGVSGKNANAAVVNAYLQQVDIPAAIEGVQKEAARIGGLRGAYLKGLADSLKAPCSK